jgi:hypothetical protein
METHKNDISTQKTTKKEKNNEKLYLFIIALLIISVGTLSYLYMKETNKVDTILVQMEGVEEENTNVKDDLENLYEDYADLETVNDTLNQEISEQKAKIQEYLVQIEKNKDDKYLIYKLRKETKTLRSIMKGYVHQIDSLNQANYALTEELEGTKGELASTKQEKSDLENIKENLEEKVSQGSILRAINFNTVGLRIKSNGGQSESDKAKKVSILKTCFTIAENKINKGGETTIYLKLSDANGNILSPKLEDGIFTTKNGQEAYSAKRTINYENVDIDLCVFYENTEAFKAGVYTLEIFTSDGFIGKTDYKLK